MHDTRVEIHEALQSAAEVGRKLLPPQADDSHLSFTWAPVHEAFVQGLVDGRFRFGLRIRDLTLLIIGSDDGVIAEFPLRGRARDAVQLAVIASLYGQAATILERLRVQFADASPVRLWPHHFDVAFLAGSMGVGFLAGDDEIDEPYWYVYNASMPDLLPALAVGEWHRGKWSGAILKGRPDSATVERFLTEAVAAVR